MHYVQPHQSEGHSINAKDKKPLRPSTPLHSTPHCTASALKPSASTQKLHAINFRGRFAMCLEIIDCCENILNIHFVTSVVALLFLESPAP